ncbi:SpoIIE family protein phosphatase [Natronosporangium hydrolyticum]|uniref:SpoIIE family protein phosphatase n=1 Tax=Natronosporangium hydrolyticum TaxID=2811111 RepID=A0A895YJX3_9ACTN|nr:SpoIIE family protein phosphatase [Natronosporangium hydrolyticum]QSB14906.1 SpoIIE family protein phosphatase [Natronosporangium hydrolyticum]
MTDAVPRDDRVVRRVRLPADRRTPASARAVVRSVLSEAQLDELADAALLLTTELSTNAVVHAGTDLDLEVIADAYGLTVTVVDDLRGIVPPTEPSAEGPQSEPVGSAPPTKTLADLADRGRGLLLVDHFATRWGTTHYEQGKGVWFRLNRPGVPEPADALTKLTELAANGPGTDNSTDVPALNALLDIAPEPYAEDPLGEFAHSLLTKMAELVGAGGGVVRYDLGEGAGPTVLARYGRAPKAGTATLRVPLALGGVATGELELDVPATAYVRPLAALVAERLTLALENDRLRRAERRRQTWLTFLAEASELLAQSLDVELTMALIPQLVVPRLGQWSAVHTTDNWGRLQLEAAAHADEESLSELHTALQQTGPDTALARLPNALRAGGQVPLPAPTEGFAIPLIARGQLLGTLSIGRHVNRRHEPDEVAVLQDVARRAALAVDNARIHAERRSVARTLQRSLLPPALPAVPGLGFGAAYVPTGDAVDVGGDFYDVVKLATDRWLVAIGDVSGKGVQAATITGLVREVIRALARGGRPLPEILERINETLVERGRGRFCTLALASVQLTDGGPVSVALHLAGHERPLLVRADGRTSSAGSGGTALGLLDTINCPAETVQLRSGDSLIFYTDGVTERRRGRELYGWQRLRDAAAPLAQYSAEVIAARLRTATIGFSSEPPRDDIALLVLRNEPPVPPASGRTNAPASLIKESSV